MGMPRGLKARYSMMEESAYPDSIPEDAISPMTPKKRGYKFNLTGRSIKGAGAAGRSNSPCSHSGYDPDMPRGMSSQLNFDMVADDKTIQKINRSFQKLRDLRTKEKPVVQYSSSKFCFKPKLLQSFV
jgi:hypothetical protein